MTSNPNILTFGHTWWVSESQLLAGHSSCVNAKSIIIAKWRPHSIVAVLQCAFFGWLSSQQANWPIVAQRYYRSSINNNWWFLCYRKLVLYSFYTCWWDCNTPQSSVVAIRCSVYTTAGEGGWTAGTWVVVAVYGTPWSKILVTVA